MLERVSGCDRNALALRKSFTSSCWHVLRKVIASSQICLGLHGTFNTAQQPKQLYCAPCVSKALPHWVHYDVPVQASWRPTI